MFKKWPFRVENRTIGWVLALNLHVSIKFAVDGKKFELYCGKYRNFFFDCLGVTGKVRTLNFRKTITVGNKTIQISIEKYAKR